MSHRGHTSSSHLPPESDDEHSSPATSDDEDEQGGQPKLSKRQIAALAEQQKKAEILVERTVIHEALVRRALYKEAKTYYDTPVIPLEHELSLDGIDQLVLSFCNIYQIANLGGFTELSELKLDNNIIEKIEGLDTLTNLTWLDLSFNKITEIEGLDKLTKLTDLSLFDNEITQIKGLDTLTNLNVLSLGNNKINDLEQIKDLRKFKNLRLLNLKGNPVCQHDDYHTTCFAWLIQLKYLDYVIIESHEFAKARDVKLDQLLLLEAKEKQQDIEEKERRVAEKYQAQLDDANLAGLSTLFNDMIKADTEHPKIKVLPGFEAIFNQYKTNFQTVVEEFSNDILQRHAVKTNELSQVQAMILKANENAEKESVKKIDRFQHIRKKVFAKYRANVEAENNNAANSDELLIENEKLIHDLKLELQQLDYDLMDSDSQLVEQVESLLEEFEKIYLKLVQENVGRINICFRTLIDVSNKHLSAVYDLTHHLLEKFTKDDTFTDDVDVKAILSDKDVLNNAVSTSHENQEAKIAAKEDEVREREDGNGKKLIRDLRASHLARHVKRVAEIQELKSRELANIEQELESGDQEED